LRHALLLVTGGPGTGKTTTIARLLVLLAAQADGEGRPAPRIALAAPTGRAAERMAGSLHAARARLADDGIDPALLERLPLTGTTLHRLLGPLPDSPRFRHHADNPLPFDLVVVDEASMIDLPLMAKLVDAVADGARLVLLGDPDQLPSVEAGDVLGGILRAAGDGEALAADDTDALRPLLGRGMPGPGPGPEAAADPVPGHSGDLFAPPAPAPEPVAAVAHPPAPGFPGARVHLQRGYRQHDSLQLAPLADAVRAGDTGRALALLRGGGLAGIDFHEGQPDPLAVHRERLLAHARALADADGPADALAIAGRLRLLTALRDGPAGALTLNARIEALLAEAGSGGGTRRDGRRHFHGQPLLVTENSYRHGLFNGDIGVCLADGSGALTAWFPGHAADADGGPAPPRPFHPAALPAHESAFAMTVHKAQGSEFDEVWLQLPAGDSRVLSRELVYTGLTRAKRRLHLAATADVLRAALARHVSRVSGLDWRLGAGARD
ncbi:AAA family ATPase, partial [Lysobacter sp. SG-8]